MIRIIYSSGLPTGSTSLPDLLLPTQRLPRKQQRTTTRTRLASLPVQGEIFWVRPHPTAVQCGLTVTAWEKIPSSARRNFNNQTSTAIAVFHSDWPEIEYLNIAGYFGNQTNFITDAPNDGYNYASSIIALVAPLSRGNISISSADMHDQPLINPNWLTDPADVQVAIAGYKRVRQLFATKAMAPVLIGPEYFPGPSVQTDAQLLQTIRQSLNTVFHAAATCAMGKTNDTNAVVDSKARVIGVKNLRVVDASAFPFLPPGHPMATVCKIFPHGPPVLLKCC